MVEIRLYAESNSYRIDCLQSMMILVQNIYTLSLESGACSCSDSATRGLVTEPRGPDPAYSQTHSDSGSGADGG